MTFDKFCVLSYVSFQFLSGLMSSDSLSMLTERRGIVSLGFTFEIMLNLMVLYQNAVLVESKGML